MIYPDWTGVYGLGYDLNLPLLPPQGEGDNPYVVLEEDQQYLGSGKDNPLLDSDGAWENPPIDSEAPLSAFVDFSKVKRQWDSQAHGVTKSFDVTDVVMALATGRMAYVGTIISILQGALMPIGGGAIPGLDNIANALDAISGTFGMLKAKALEMEEAVYRLDQTVIQFHEDIAASVTEVTGVPVYVDAPWSGGQGDGYGYAGGWDSHAESTERNGIAVVDISVKTAAFEIDAGVEVKTLNTAMREFQDAVKNSVRWDKEATNTVDTFKSFNASIDNILKLKLLLVRGLAGSIMTLPAAVAVHSYISAVMGWLKSIVAELQEIEQILSQVSGTAKQLEQQVKHAGMGFGVPY